MRLPTKKTAQAAHGSPTTDPSTGEPWDVKRFYPWGELRNKPKDDTLPNPFFCNRARFWNIESELTARGLRWTYFEPCPGGDMIGWTRIPVVQAEINFAGNPASSKT